MSRDWQRLNRQLLHFEQKLLPQKYKMVAGIDEAGRGPLAGPVVACAVILKAHTFASRIFDSKRLSLCQRQEAFGEIIKKAQIGVGIVDREIIDKENIFQATLLAIRQALDNLPVSPEYLLVDGRFKQLDLPFPAQSVVGGDSRCLSIACASIVAKVVRDNLMCYYAAIYPQYGFERNRGYYTREHLRAIKRYGLAPVHRRSFRPIRRLKRILTQMQATERG